MPSIGKGVGLPTIKIISPKKRANKILNRGPPMETMILSNPEAGLMICPLSVFFFFFCVD